jgi:Tfp pilus assembly protein PilZ
MTNQLNSDKCCPFWDMQGKRTCRLVESGLFIPTRDHILHFCENESFVQCYHYVGKSVPQEELVSKSKKRPLRNRRLYTRIPTREKLSVSRYSMSKEINEDIIDSQAMVLDLSLGGMQIETNEEIHLNQIISFSFDENFHPPGFKGRGEIRWIQQDKSQDYPSNAGMAFVDDETTNTVRNHLMGMGEKLLRLSGF